MVYKVGKDVYKSQKSYERLLVLIGAIFLFSLYLLIVLKTDMSIYLFYFTFYLDLCMLAHLAMRFLDSRKIVKYVFNEY